MLPKCQPWLLTNISGWNLTSVVLLDNWVDHDLCKQSKVGWTRLGRQVKVDKLDQMASKVWYVGIACVGVLDNMTRCLRLHRDSPCFVKFPKLEMFLSLCISRGNWWIGRNHKDESKTYCLHQHKILYVYVCVCVCMSIYIYIYIILVKLKII